MKRGWSLRKFEGKWCEEEFSTAILAENILDLEIPDDGDTIEVRAVSGDGGLTLTGTYHFREGSYSDGVVTFQRYKGAQGEILVGEWKEVGTAAGAPWVIKISG